MQTILGSGGVIGKGLAKELLQYTDRIRLASRNPKAVNPGDELFTADLADAGQVMKAVENSEVVYLAAGLQYNLQTWRRLWPVIMTNVIEACKKHKARFVFFDNVYSYGRVDGWMTEETPYNPCSKKGEVRVRIAEQLMREVKAGILQALIARSADFYGPGATNTANYPMVFEKLRDGKSANWLCNDKVKHSLTYAPDAAKGTAVLGNTIDAFNQVWHLPTDRNALTGKEFIELAAKAAGTEPKYTILKTWMMQMAGIFNPLARESVEMMYQQEYDYLFDSSKFEKRFFKAVSYEEGIAKTIESMR